MKLAPPYTNRERAIWNAAITLANNLCVQLSDRHLADDENDEAMACSACATRIRSYLDDLTPLEDVNHERV